MKNEHKKQIDKHTDEVTHQKGRLELGLKLRARGLLLGEALGRGVGLRPRLSHAAALGAGVGLGVFPQRSFARELPRELLHPRLRWTNSTRGDGRATEQRAHSAYTQKTSASV